MEYFDAQNIINPYFSDFKSALKPLASEFDNELEQEMKLRFLKEIKSQSKELLLLKMSNFSCKWL